MYQITLAHLKRTDEIVRRKIESNIGLILSDMNTGTLIDNRCIENFGLFTL